MLLLAEDGCCYAGWPWTVLSWRSWSLAVSLSSPKRLKVRNQCCGSVKINRTQLPVSSVTAYGLSAMLLHCCCSQSLMALPGPAEVDADAQARPAVITVMGHVDHGKVRSAVPPHPSQAASCALPCFPPFTCNLAQQDPAGLGFTALA